MAGPNTLPRDLLLAINPDMRWVRVMEQLLNIVPDDNESLRELAESAKFEAGSAMARAQQAISSIKKQFGSFLSTIDQAGSAVDTPTAATFNTTTASNGVSMSGSRITVTKSGFYEVEMRVQL